MKKFLIASVALLLFAAVLFSSCQKGEAVPLEGVATVVLDNGSKDAASGYLEFTVDLKEAGITDRDKAIDVIEYLKKDGLYYSGTFSSSFGAYLTEIGTERPAENPSYEGETVKTPFLKENAGGYIALYTSCLDEGNPDADSFGGTIAYKGVSVYYAMLGISSLSVEDGVVYYFMYTAF